MDRKRWGQLAGCIMLCLGAGGIGSLFTAPNSGRWYAYLNKPFFNPPNWIFGPVWTLLYVMMGTSLYIVWGDRDEKGKKAANKALKLFGVQLLLNTLWSIVFFGMQNPGLALMEIIALWIAIFMTIKAFYPISKKAAYLLIPYLAWVSFATLLNGTIVLLN